MRLTIPFTLEPFIKLLVSLRSVDAYVIEKFILKATHQRIGPYYIQGLQRDQKSGGGEGQTLP